MGLILKIEAGTEGETTTSSRQVRTEQSPDATHKDHRRMLHATGPEFDWKQQVADNLQGASSSSSCSL